MITLLHRPFALAERLRELPIDTRKGIRWFVAFLLIMALLTLLSNVASGATIARVTANFPVRASISDTVVMDGIVTARITESVPAPDGVKVKRTLVESGSNVKFGDALLLFDEAKLAAALKRSTVELGQLQAQVNVLGVAEQSSDKLEARRDQDSIENAKLELESLRGKLQRAVNAADRAYREATRDYTKARSDYRESDSGSNYVVSALSHLDKAESKVESTRADFDAKKNAYDKLLETDTDLDHLEKAKTALDSAEEAMAAAEKKYDTALENYYDAIAEAAGSSDENSEQNLRNYELLKSAHDKLSDARAALEEAKISQKEQFDKAERAVAQLELQGEISSVERKNSTQSVWSQSIIGQAEKDLLLFEIEEKQADIALLKQISDSGGKLTSTVDGTLLPVELDTSGNLTGGDAVRISTTDGGYEATVKLPADDAKGLQNGMNATAEFDGKMTKATVSRIGLASDEQNLVVVTVRLFNETWQDGQTVKITIEKSKANYDVCVPLGAIRSDSDGDFVYVFEEEKTVMGIQTTLRQIYIEVLMRDGHNAAISGTVGRDSQVLVNSSRPVSAGDRVRLMDTSERW